ncbi:hypothetical protein KGF56_003003 [Candida oxycetoniae]|uniref:Small ribosomal subunit protein uS11m n=1 Tax=Candida oxycetoniae TaxID=497107 RepID=A0AAI9WXH3_9ASCO|nr:uncharacterized protein KGF56_003003 [Candida oxycetoniae]KAI3404242.2 hypothetical protein KGF56_003003 [Candida oxycetoniae]
MFLKRYINFQSVHSLLYKPVTTRKTLSLSNKYFSTSRPTSQIDSSEKTSPLSNLATTYSTQTRKQDFQDFQEFPEYKPSTNKPNEKIVFWKLYATFNRHNTRCTLVAVVEDLNFMENNKDLSYNEKVLYYLQLPHKVKYSVSAGMLGFRKSQRQEYEAGFQVAAKMFKTIEEKNYIGPNDKIELVLKNFGKGREAFQAALLGKEGSNVKNNIVRMTDATILKFGGNRAKKLRRL